MYPNSNLCIMEVSLSARATAPTKSKSLCSSISSNGPRILSLVMPTLGNPSFSLSLSLSFSLDCFSFRPFLCSLAAELDPADAAAEVVPALLVACSHLHNRSHIRSWIESQASRRRPRRHPRRRHVYPCMQHALRCLVRRLATSCLTTFIQILANIYLLHFFSFSFSVLDEDPSADERQYLHNFC